MSNIPYPPKDCEITFREPFFKREWNINKFRYYIKTCIDQGPGQEIMIASRQQECMDYLLKVDLKLTNAIVRSDSQGRWVVLKHSPQGDFFDLVKGENNGQNMET